MNWCICEPGGYTPGRQQCSVAPSSEFLAKAGVAEFLLSLGVAVLLQQQCLIERNSLATSEPAHVAALRLAWHQFVFEGLQAFHSKHHTPPKRRIQGKDYTRNSNKIGYAICALNLSLKEEACRARRSISAASS